MRYVNAVVLSAPDNLTPAQNGSTIDCNQLISASFQCIFADTTAAGTFKLQASNDLATNTAQNFVPTNWTDIPTQTATITSGASALLTINQVTYRWIRAVYTRTSGGTTTVSVQMLALSL